MKKFKGKWIALCVTIMLAAAVFSGCASLTCTHKITAPDGTEYSGYYSIHPSGMTKYGYDTYDVSEYSTFHAVYFPEVKEGKSVEIEIYLGYEDSSEVVDGTNVINRDKFKKMLHM